jgi:hypothetical protein
VKYAKYATMVLMLALIVAFSTPQAAAQQLFKGTFNLTTEAYWGSKLLQPGHYEIAVTVDPARESQEVRLTATDFRTSFFSGPGISEQISDRNSLRLEYINGIYVVRSLDAGLVGHTYRFAVSKTARMRVEQASAPSQVTVPIATSSAY